MSSQPFIFVGFGLEPPLVERFASCGEGSRVFLRDPVYLEILKVGERDYVGKRIEVGLAGDRLEDAVRSVASMIARVAPGYPISADDAHLLALEEKLPPDVSREV